MSTLRLSFGADRLRATGRACRQMVASGSIRSTIMLAFLAICLLTGGLGLFAASALIKGRMLVGQAFGDALTCINSARAARGDIDAMNLLYLRLGPSTDQAQRALLDNALAAASEQLDQDLDIATAHALSPAGTASAVALREAVARWQTLLDASPPVRRRIEAARDEVDQLVERLISQTIAVAYRQRDATDARIGQFIGLAITGTVAALALSVLVIRVLARRIIGPVAAASQVAERIAAGDMYAVVPPGGQDELGRLLTSMASMRDSIRTMMEREKEQRRFAQTRLVDAFEGSSEGVILVGTDRRIALANTQAISLLAPLGEQLQAGVEFAALAEAARRQAVFPATGADGSGGAIHWLAPDWSGECEVELAGERWLRVSRSISSDGEFIVILSDISALKSYQQALELANARFRAALNNMTQGLILFDAEDRLQVVNDRYREIYGLPEGVPPMGISQRALLELRIAHTPWMRARAVDIRNQRATLALSTTKTKVFEEIPDGRTIAITHVPIEQGGWVATFEDVTEQHRNLAQIHYMARHDQLTGLGNRTLFNEQLLQALAELEDGMHVAVLHVNLDHFKPINDTLGHLVGDELLRIAARRMLESRGNANAVARLSGDEFAIIMANIPRAEYAANMALWIIDAFCESFQVDGHDIVLGASIGIALAPGDGQTPETLAEHAERAMDRAKADERGSYRFFEPAMNARLQERHALELDLRKALDLRQLEVFYQPQVDIAERRITGFEALLRWHHPVRGMVSPAEFIPMAEELGLIVRIGEWVLREACRVACAWPARIHVGVNISPIQFRSPLLVDMVRTALAESGLDPARLELEITESALLDDDATTLGTLGELKQLGLRIAMDDFGTGYSSLSYLRSFPFDKLKIDKSFIRDLQADNNSGAIVQAIVAMGHTLGMRTIAEGVETTAQLALVEAAGCQEVQGYLFGRPGPVAGIPALLARELTPTDV